MARSQAESSKMEDFQNRGGYWKWGYQTWATVVLFVSCIILSTTRLPQVSADLTNETNVLLDIKRAWGNPSSLNSWSRQFNTCSQWLYVTCNAENTTIIALEITNTEGTVQSPLPTSIAALVNLRTLNFDSWGLTGEIPSTIGLMTSLTYLGISRNPGLSGLIPKEIGNLTKLSYLNLQTNNLTGQLPDALANLQSLSYLSISNNLNTGPLPSWIGGFPLLESLWLENQGFTGTIPPSLGNLTQLRQMTLTAAWNSNAGPLPPELGKLASLTNFVMASNVFDSEIPESYSNLSALISVDLDTCQLYGTIPSWFGNFSNLTGLDLSSNSLSGPIPPQLGDASSLNILRLYSNNLNQTIPTQLGQLSQLLYLDLHQNDLTGPIPTQLTGLANLTQLDLSVNSLTGEIPPQLVKIPSLTTLTVDDNCLSGPIPTYNASQLVDVNFGQDLLNSNCFNASQACKCGGAPGPQVALTPVAGGDSGVSKTADRVYIALGVVLGSLLALSSLLLLWFMRHKHQKKAVNPSGTYKGSVRQYTVPEIREATTDFTTKVGEGAFATVYKAVFADGVIAAVKRFNKKRPAESFEQEVEVLSSLSHRFLVNLIGYCEDCGVGELMLLYEFMDRGNLSENLHGEDHAKVPLTWEERVRVLISVGHGIDYLHYGTDPPMIHRDIKSANILLSCSGSTLIAKLADFGLGRQTVVDADVITATFGNEPPKSFVATKVAGTPGYLDPEYFSTSVLSPKTDVYSYGVVLLELITGRKPLLEERLTLSNWAKPYLVDENIWPILDPKLEKGTFDEEQLRAVAELALCCTESDSRKRPTIKEVLAVLTDLFSIETRMVNPSLRTSSGVEFSGSSSQTHSQSRTLDIENSMNYTYSEVLPRD